MVTHTENFNIISNYGIERVGIELSKRVLSVVTWTLEITKRDADRHERKEGKFKINS
jgi:hypothetical protein